MVSDILVTKTPKQKKSVMGQILFSPNTFNPFPNIVWEWIKKKEGSLFPQSKSCQGEEKIAEENFFFLIHFTQINLNLIKLRVNYRCLGLMLWHNWGKSMTRFVLLLTVLIVDFMKIKDTDYTAYYILGDGDSVHHRLTFTTGKLTGKFSTLPFQNEILLTETCSHVGILAVSQKCERTSLY